MSEPNSAPRASDGRSHDGMLRLLLRTLAAYVFMVWAFLSVVVAFVVVGLWARLRHTPLDRVLRRITNPAPPRDDDETRS